MVIRPSIFTCERPFLVYSRAVPLDKEARDTSVTGDGVTAAIFVIITFPQNRVVNTWCALTNRACDPGGKPFLIAISRTLEVEVLKNT